MNYGIIFPIGDGLRSGACDTKHRNVGMEVAAQGVGSLKERQPRVHEGVAILLLPISWSVKKKRNRKRNTHNRAYYPVNCSPN